MKRMKPCRRAEKDAESETVEKDAKLEALTVRCKKRRLRAPQNHVPVALSLIKTFEDKSAASGTLDKLLDETILRVLEGNRQWKPILVQTRGVPPGAY